MEEIGASADVVLKATSRATAAAIRALENALRRSEGGDRRLASALLALALFGGDPAAAAEPLEKAREIVAAMKPGTWRELEGTRIREVFPKREGHPAWAVQGPDAVTNNWGGAAFDTKRNILVVTGGGHNDYGGNEVYHFSLETLRWTRATEPSPVEPVPGPDGRPTKEFRVADGSEAPVSSHTYDGLQYLPNVDRVFKFGGSYYMSGNSYDAHAYLYDVEKRRWTRGAKAPRASLEVATAYRPSTGEVLVAFTNGLMAYDPVRDRWRDLVTSDGWGSGLVADFDPLRERYVELGDFKAPFVFRDMKPPSGRRPPPLASEISGRRLRGSGIAFHPPTRRFAVWSGGREIWTIDADSWALARLANPNGPAPSAVDPAGKKKFWGIYSRWQYVPALDVFIAYPSSYDNVWLYRLPPKGFEEAAVRDRCGGADLCVGPGYRYSKPSDAAAEAKAGQTVAIAAGDYVDCAVWRVSVTIRGYNGRPRIRDKTCGGKAVWVVAGEDTRIENVELAGAWSSDGNGAAIRFEGSRLVLRDCLVHDNQMGVLTGHGRDAELRIENCEFYGQRSNAALAHSIYAGKIKRFVARGNYIHGVSSGHHIKSVARENEIVANRLVDETGTEASMIDVWGCSRSLIEGNAMTKAGVGGNLNFVSVAPRVEYGKVVACDDLERSDVAIAYNTAVFTGPDPLWSALFQNSFGAKLRAYGNLVVNTRSVEAPPRKSAPIPAASDDNLLVRGLQDASGLFVNLAEGDLRPARQIGGDRLPGAGPKLEYRHPASTGPRPGAATFGAFEFAAKGASR
jgi:hypothetical protein